MALLAVHRLRATPLKAENENTRNARKRTQNKEDLLPS